MVDGLERPWTTGEVDELSEHILLSFRVGQLERPPFQYVQVARVGRNDHGLFEVTFLSTAFERRLFELGALNFLFRELDYILSCDHIQGWSRWDYAVYHCSTFSNVYSSVYWEYLPEGKRNSAHDCLT